MQTHISKMTVPEFEAHIALLVPEYAQDKVASGQWAESEALTLARKGISEDLPQGLATPDQWFYAMRDGDARYVGAIWISAQVRGGQRVAWLSDIAVLPQFQRLGHARRALVALELEVQSLGLVGIALHVFGHNTAAQVLYQSLGFATTNINMFKALG